MATLVCAAAFALAACGNGGKPGDQPAQGQAAPGQGEDAYETSLTGYVSRTYDCDHDLCLTATTTALKRLGLRVGEQKGGMFRKSLSVESEDGTAVAVDMTEIGRAATRIEIKVGYGFGDRDAARRIHSEIEAEISGRRQQAQDVQKKWRGLSLPEPPPPAEGAGKGEPQRVPAGR
jgi:hypothetical protein